VLPVRIAIRVIIGTVIYACIVYLAASAPAAAGMMLTFPALNGLALFFSGKESVAPMTRTMLWMPVINSALCALFMVLFLGLAKMAPPQVLAWSLAALITVLWLVLVSRRKVQQGIAAHAQFAFAVAASVIAVLLTAAALYVSGPAGVAHVTWTAQLPALTDVLQHNDLKIALFASCFAVFLIATAWLPISDAVKGILAGLPIVPFGGLVSVAADSGINLDNRLATLHAMSTSVWLGATVAIWYVVAISRYFTARRTLPVPSLDSAVLFAALVAGWLACFAVILGISFVVGQS
jgi:hypothetical protein